MKKLRMIVSIILTLVLFSSMTFGVLAESSTGTVDSSAGEVDVTITVEKDGANSTTTVETENGGFMTEDGTLVNWQEVTDEIYIYDAEGNIIGQRVTTEGSETTEKPADQEDVTVDLIVDSELQGTDNGDGTHTVVGGGETTTEPTNPGDDLKSENLNNFNQTTTTDREVEVTVSDPKVTTGTIIYVDENGNQIELHPTDDGYAFSSNYAKNYIFDVEGNPVDPYNPGESVDVVNICVVDENGEIIDQVEGAIVQFKVVNNETGESHMKVYCVDANTGVMPSYNYRRANLEDAVAEGYYSEEEAKHLRAILMHGYTWADGAETGANLDEIKAMMLAALEKGEISGVTPDQINAMTGSDASTATGMAIWTFGNRFEVPEAGSIKVTGTDDAAINALYQYLLTLEEEAPDTETQIINEEKFVKDMDITVGEMVQKNNGDDDIYNVSLSFSLVVEPDPKNDDLIVKVVDGQGNVIRSARIAGEGKDETDKLFDGIELSKNEKGETVYTFTDLHLQENSNTTFNLTLEGAQLLNEGVYVYKAKEAADPMGAAQEWAEYYKQMGSYKGYEEGFYKHHVENATPTKYKFVLDKDGNYVPANPNDTYTWEEAEANLMEYWAERYGVQLTNQNFIGIMSGTAEVDVKMEIDLTFNVEEGTIVTEREWFYHNESLIPTSYEEIPDEEPPLDEEPPMEEEQEPEYEEILDLDVPLADVPVTGDSSALWIVLAALSLAGLLVLNLGKKRTA